MNLKTCLTVALTTLILCACGQGESKEISPEEQAKINAAVTVIKSEPRVKDFHYEELSDGIAQWNVGVIPTEGSEIGYASYICDVLHEYDLNKQIVRIVDITQVVNEGATPKAASLKRIKCETYTVWPD